MLAAGIPGLTSLQNVTGWTIMGYLRLFSTGTRVLWDVSGGTGTNTRAAIQAQGTGDLAVQARSTDGESLRTLLASAAVSVGELFHFAGVADYVGKTLQIFKNGVQIANGPAAFAASASANTVSNAAFVGSDAGGTSGFMDGVVDDCRIYNRVLGAGEIMTIASLYGQDKLLDGLTNRYIFNEFPDDTSAAGPGIYVDYGSNQRNADGNGAIFTPSIIRFKNGKGRQSVVQW